MRVMNELIHKLISKVGLIFLNNAQRDPEFLYKLDVQITAFDQKTCPQRYSKTYSPIFGTETKSWIRKQSPKEEPGKVYLGSAVGYKGRNGKFVGLALHEGVVENINYAKS